MELHKENVQDIKNKTKIPLLLAPLPGVPQILAKHNTVMERHPLRTVNRQDLHIAGTSTCCSQKIDKLEDSEKETKKVQNKTNIPLNIDTRYVTVRQKTEDLDWDYKVFKDDSVKENSVIVISDDEETSHKDKCHQIPHFISNRRNNCIGDTTKAETPRIKSPPSEPNRGKNIKRSLKRPHSRELQGISPITKQERGEGKHRRQLQFDKRLLPQSPETVLKDSFTSLNREDITDILTYLMNTEKKANAPKINSHTRSCIINWIIKVHGPTGSPSTIQYAQWYFDAMLAVNHIHIDQLQLFAAACYWLAQKIHGPYSYSKKIIKCSGYAFSCEKLLAAEKIVLLTLNYSLQPVIPQDFISYLSFCCDTSQTNEIEEGATFIYMAGMMVDKHLCEIWPSVLAAAAVRNAVLLLRKKEAVVKLQMNSIYKEAEKKTSNISYICSIQRKIVRLISSSSYEYTALLVKYGGPPNNIAQKIVNSVNEFAVFNTRTGNEHAP